MTTENTGIKLTASQIKDFDEISADTKAAELTLEVALRFHANSRNQIMKKLKTMWDELSLAHDLDLREYEYFVDCTGASPVITRRLATESDAQ